MRQLTFIRPGTLEWQDVPAPTLQDARAALVRPLAVARCDLDLYIYTGRYRNPGPFAFGHEIAGEVVDVGSAVISVTPGDRVIVPFQISCGTCAVCVRGHTNACTAVPPMAAYGLGTHPESDWGGGFADLVRVPFADAMLLPLPHALSPEAAAGLGDNVADGYRTVAPRLAADPGSPVLVVGGLARSVGLYAVHAAIALGASEVLYTDSDAERLRLAALAGARTEAVDYATAHRASGVRPIVVDASGTADGLRFALRSTAPCGHCTGVSGGTRADTTIPLQGMYLRGITYEVSRVQSRSVLPEVLRHACSGSLDPLAFARPPLPFSAAPDAMDDPAPKLVFVPDERASLVTDGPTDSHSTR